MDPELPDDLASEVRRLLGLAGATGPSKAMLQKYHDSFRRSGVEKAEAVLEDLRGRASRVQPSRCAYFSIGGSTGDEIFHVMENSAISHGVILEYDDWALEVLRENRENLEISGKEIEIITGDAGQKLSRCIDILKDWREGGRIDGVICSAQAVLHELPTRSFGFRMDAFLDELCWDWYPFVFYSREPCQPINWPSEVRLRVPGLDSDLLRAFAERVNKYLAFGEVPKRSGPEFVIASSALAVEVLFKLFYRSDFQYELQERVTSVDPREFVSLLKTALGPDGRVYESSETSKSFQAAYTEYGIDTRYTNSARSLEVPECFIRVVGERLSPVAAFSVATSPPSGSHTATTVPHPKQGPDLDSGGPRKHSLDKFEAITLDRLSGRCILLAGFDFHNIRLHLDSFGDEPALEEQLEAALLLGDKVIVHWLDPLRSERVFQVLQRYRDFINQQRILFLMNRNVTDLKADYPDELRRKIGKYHKEGNVYSDEEIQGMNNRVGAIVELVASGRTLLKRRPNYDSGLALRQLIEQDLSKSETVVTTLPFRQSILRHAGSSLTLHEILHLTELDPPVAAAGEGDDWKGTIRPVYEPGARADLIDEILHGIRGRGYRRTAIMRSFRERLNTSRGRSFYDQLFARRLGHLHSRINADSHAVLELHSADTDHPYRPDWLWLHLRCIQEWPGDVLGPTIIQELLATGEEFRSFVRYHLTILSDVRAQRYSGARVSEEEAFGRVQGHIDDFRAIEGILAARPKSSPWERK
jgi:hypothetical protein